jgi:hypothetical protein
LKPLAWAEDLHVWGWRRSRPQRRAGLLIAAGWLPGEEDEKARNVHLASYEKIDAEAALQKARMLKAETLAIRLQ